MVKVLRFLDRHSVHEATILQVYPIGELHAGVCLFSREDGIISAIAYGIRSPKSSLQGSISPLVRGRCTLYHKDESARKITRFEIHEDYHFLRKNLFAYCFASIWAELMRKTHVGMDAGTEVYQLFTRALSAINRCSREETYILHAQFLWRYFRYAGFRSQLPENLTEKYYLGIDNEITRERGGVEIASSVLEFLRDSEKYSLSQLCQRTSAHRQAMATWGFLKVFLTQVVGNPLNSLRVAEEILF